MKPVGVKQKKCLHHYSKKIDKKKQELQSYKPWIERCHRVKRQNQNENVPLSIVAKFTSRIQSEKVKERIKEFNMTSQ